MTGVVLLIALSATAWIDLRCRKIPNWIVDPAVALCLGIAFCQAGLDGFASAASGLIVCGGLAFLAWRCDSIGGGDVKLAGLIGTALGWAEGLDVLLWASLFAAVLMLGAALKQDGFHGIWRSLRGAMLPSGGTEPAATKVRPMHLGPAALMAVVVIEVMRCVRLGD